MPQFLIPPDAFDGDAFELSGDEAFHLVRVMRYGPSDEVTLFDGKGNRFRARIEKVVDSRTVRGTVLERVAARPRILEVDLSVALIARDRFEDVLVKGTEIGVARFKPVLTERTEVKFKRDARAFKMERWRKLLTTASKQCGRDRIPEVFEPVPLSTAVAEALPGEVVLCDPSDDAAPLGELLEGLDPVHKTLQLFVGPEGGFTERERQGARRLGARTASLGRHVLRAETAAVCAAALALLAPRFERG